MFPRALVLLVLFVCVVVADNTAPAPIAPASAEIDDKNAMLYALLSRVCAIWAADAASLSDKEKKIYDASEPTTSALVPLEDRGTALFDLVKRSCPENDMAEFELCERKFMIEIRLLPRSVRDTKYDETAAASQLRLDAVTESPKKLELDVENQKEQTLQAIAEASQASRDAAEAVENAKTSVEQAKADLEAAIKTEQEREQPLTEWGSSAFMMAPVVICLFALIRRVYEERRELSIK